MEHYYTDGTEPTILRRMPNGCDQQGRYPQAAEAATELGVEEPEHDMLRVVAEDTVLALAVLAIVGVMVMAAVGAFYG